MENTRHKLYVLLTIVSMSCASNVELDQGTSEEQLEEVNLDVTKDSTLVISAIENQSIPLIKLKSKIRPYTFVFPNEVYTDSIEFIGYNNDFDYFILTGKKNAQEIDFIYHWQWKKNDTYNFKAGELIEVTWKMDSFWVAGDGERLDFHEWIIDAKKIK